MSISVLHVQGRNCEHNYDDCLVQPCPGGYSWVDSINEVSCQPAEGDMSSVPWEPSMTQTPRGSLLTTSPMSPVSPYSEQPTGMEVNRKDHSHITVGSVLCGQVNRKTSR